MPKNPHSHPAHRLPKEAALPTLHHGRRFVSAVARLASSRTTTEIPGVYYDELTDEIIHLARKWIIREKQTSAFIAELEG